MKKPRKDLNKPPKAYRNEQFLTSSAARSIRVQCELTEPKHRLKKHRINNTLVFFGSARIKHPDDAQTEWEKKTARYYTMASELAREMTEWTLNNHPAGKRYHICSGGGPGIMEAANRGAAEAGGKNVGFGISLPFEQYNNQYITDDLNFEFHYFFVRKYWFTYLAKAFVVFPGGFGTLDELFENFTLIQTEKTKKDLPVVLLDSTFWNDIIKFKNLADWGTISPEDLDLFKICDTVEEAKEYLIGELTRLQSK